MSPLKPKQVQVQSFFFFEVRCNFVKAMSQQKRLHQTKYKITLGEAHPQSKSVLENQMLKLLVYQS